MKGERKERYEWKGKGKGTSSKMVSNLVLLWILIVSLLETKASVASCPIPPSQPWEKRANHRQDRDPDMKTWPSKTSSLERRNLGSVLRDEYLMHAYPNFYCSADGRVIRELTSTLPLHRQVCEAGVVGRIEMKGVGG
ncbi:hypothetical protein IE53DRAFT_174702 [Violaceomyces palustris]|uniref:Uncharacterized protein n=1 Tax=Violaceomyces palustris TaxID=1673888 RepID=A0ACD0NSW7_9BASI|nr:hypothetical protein IE53DRAFT_174702 [Violaceomyces palustris]